MVTIAEELNRAMAAFADAGIDSPQLDAEVLMSQALGLPRVKVISHPKQRLTIGEMDRFRAMVARRLAREPLAYILGYREFWGLDFEVTSAVLIPRPETETLVDIALSELRKTERPLAVDIGTGSGAIAVTLAIELPDAVVYATEISHAAAEVAGRNAKKHNVQDQVQVLEGDMFSPLPAEVCGRLDAILSNPPYVPQGDVQNLQPEIVRFEPSPALGGGEDGMKFHRLILDAGQKWLRPGGTVHLEIGIGQEDDVMTGASEMQYTDISSAEDLAGIVRVVSARKPEGR